MTTKQELPEEATWEDIQERIYFVAGVRKALRELDEDKGIPHERTRDEFSEWLTHRKHTYHIRGDKIDENYF